ncbi:MAG: hypothetical protein OEU84_15705 [Xanthomonadales bacterium]|nr:hypothetical protein [Xanthomonadales bacterium]
MGRLVLIAPLLLITSFAWFGFSNQEADDPAISAEHATRLIANQSDRTGEYSTTDQIPEQVGDPDKKTTTPTPEDLDSVVAASPDPEERKKNERLAMPEWEKIFNPNGTLKDEVNHTGTITVNGVPDYIDIYDGVYAEFILEEFSNGIATDMSALLPAEKISDEVIYRGEVNAAHDLGHVYFLRSMGKDDHARVYVGIERLIVPVDSFIEIEFNQLPVKVGSGNPWWQLKGERKDGDLLARINLTRGQPAFVEIEEWQGSAYALLDTYNGSPGHGCVRQPAFMYCSSEPPIEHPTQGFESWDSNFQLVETIPPDNFLQLGVDLKRMLGFNRNFSGILVRTPEDIVVKGFRASRQTAFLDQY